MTSWKQYLEPLGVGDEYNSPPVAGQVAVFEDLASKHQDLKNLADSLSAGFESIVSGESLSIRGEAAGAMAELVEEVSNKLKHISPIAQEVFTIFSSHKNQLLDLKEEASSAYNRAALNWQNYESAKASEEAVQFSDPNIVDLSITTSSNVDSALDDLRGSKAEYDAIASEADAMDRLTADKIAEIDLGPLEDPAWWEKAVGFAINLYLALSPLDEIIDLVNAIASGDWDRIWWRLKDLLTFIGIALAIVGFFAGGWVIALIGLAVAVSILAIDAYLYYNKIEDPDNPGTFVTPKDLIFDVVGVVFAGSGLLGEVGELGKLTKLMNFGTPTVKTSSVIEHIGVLDQTMSIHDITVYFATEISDEGQDVQACFDNQVDQLEGLEDDDFSGMEKILVGSC